VFTCISFIVQEFTIVVNLADEHAELLNMMKIFNGRQADPFDQKNADEPLVQISLKLLKHN
jgi:hypothetical protein